MEPDKKYHIFIAFLFIVLIAIDRITKILANNYLHSTIALLPFFSLHLTKNTGAAFGIFPGWNIFFTIIGIIAFIGIVFYMSTQINRLKRSDMVLFVMLLAGIIGNLLDRIFGGSVIDFLYLSHWPIFNFADVYISISITLFIIFELRNKYCKKNHDKKKINKNC